MEQVFTKEQKEIFSIAKKLELIGESELSKLFCRKYIKEISLYHGEDIISLFYGKAIYDKIKNVGDAMSYAFIIACAKQSYDVIYPKNPMSSATNGWARYDNNVLNESLRDVFRWLSQPNRSVLDKDYVYFKKLKDIISSNDVTYKISNGLLNVKLPEIVEMLVNNNIKISTGGELI